MEAMYVAEALSTGSGRTGHVRTSDGRLDLDLAVPRELGGSGNGANPELLFAAGYAACFHNALLLVARELKVPVTGTAVGARVGLDRTERGNLDLQVELEVVIPDVPADQAQKLADLAHHVCPYSRATRGNIPVTVVVTDG